MGPRKQLASRPKRTIPSRGGERRTKARHDPASSSPSRVPSSPPSHPRVSPPSRPSAPSSSRAPPPSRPGAPSSSRAQPSRPRAPLPVLAAERMAGRIIACGRRINFVYFEAQGFSLGQWIRLAGCERFCSLSERFYPHLIREFYGSLVRDADGLSATVRGVSFTITAEVLGVVWGIPCLGPTSDCLGDREAGIACILEREDVRGITTVTAIQLSVEMRLLHHVVARIFLPKTGRFDYITERELMVMTTLVRGLVLNIPGVFLRQIREAAESRRLCLPYGMALTLLFRHFGVPLDGEVYHEIHHTDTYDDRSLHRMGYRMVSGRWTRRGSGQDPDSDSEEAELHAAEAGPSGTAGADTEADGEPSTPPPQRVATPPRAAVSTGAPRCCTSQSQIDSLRDELHSLRDELRSSVTELRQEISTGFADMMAAFLRQSATAPAPQSSDSSSSSDSPPPPEDQDMQDSTPVEDPVPHSSPAHDTSADPAPAPPVSDEIHTAPALPSSPRISSSRAVGFHTPGFFCIPSRRTSGRTRRISYRTSSRVQTPQIIECSSDSDD